MYSPHHSRSSRRAFSLVEVTLALGIMGFALVALLGLLPAGLSTFHSATVNSTGTQIAQRLLNEAQQTDFDQLVATVPMVRYFDDQGDELTAANKAQAIYNTNVVVAPSTTLPGGAANPNLATVFVQVADDPGSVPLTSDANKHWVASAGMTISAYAANVARSK